MPEADLQPIPVELSLRAKKLSFGTKLSFGLDRLYFLFYRTDLITTLFGV
jgi:hypothetical protein